MTDLDLINRIKQANDSAALNELIHRHTGLYVSTVQKYSSIEKSIGCSHKLDVAELKDDKAFNIYQCVLSYNPTKNMAFSTYVADQTRFLCLNKLNREPNMQEFSEAVAPTNDTGINERVDHNEALEKVTTALADMRADNAADPRFFDIFSLRYAAYGKPQSWRAVGKRLKISHERAREIYLENIDKLKERIKV